VSKERKKKKQIQIKRDKEKALYTMNAARSYMRVSSHNLSERGERVREREVHLEASLAALIANLLPRSKRAGRRRES